MRENGNDFQFGKIEYGDVLVPTKNMRLCEKAVSSAPKFREILPNRGTPDPMYYVMYLLPISLTVGFSNPSGGPNEAELRQNKRKEKR